MRDELIVYGFGAGPSWVRNVALPNSHMRICGAYASILVD